MIVKRPQNRIEIVTRPGLPPVLAPKGKLVSPSDVFGENGMYGKDVEDKTKQAFKVLHNNRKNSPVNKLQKNPDLRDPHLREWTLDFILYFIAFLIMQSSWVKN